MTAPANDGQSRPSSPNPRTDPLPIRRLQESLINRIAAGEIIHRPASALKELLENSLDARSSSIRVTVKDGGMKLLQIQDNGCGIRKADLPILAQRFTTSKISKFSDLSRLTTYGFRGEALASVSHVAHLSVVTKTKKDACAWKACYADGSLVAPKPGQTADPKPCAGNEGTIITIEDLFYNTPTRLSALRGSSEEYARILDILTKYAVHNPSISFVCKKAGSSSPDLLTPSSSSTPHAIRLLYGHSIAKNLLLVTLSSTDKSTHMEIDDSQHRDDDDDPESWTAEAHFTNVNYHAKKMIFLLFINHRLVDSPRMKRALEAAYSGILPKGASPFVYLSLHIDPRSVDINVHPTKREVHFLNEDVIIERILDAVQVALVGQSQSRVFEYQTLLTGGIAEPAEISKKRKGKERATQEEGEGTSSPASSSGGSGARPSVDSSKLIMSRLLVIDPKKVLSQHKVRTNLKERTLDSMFPIVNPSCIDDHNNTVEPSQSQSKSREIKESECYLSSVRKLRQAVLKGKHNSLSEILEKHTFVGIIDLNRCLSLIQHSTKLYLINHAALAEELFYQLGVRQFGDFSRLKLEPPPPLRAIVKLAVDAEEGTKHSTLSKAEIVDIIVETLLARREMLAEYFSLNISEDGMVESLPILLRGYTPNLDKLPCFVMRLGPQVDWTSEAECFDSFIRELAYFYIPAPLPSTGKSLLTDEENMQENSERWQIEHVLFPAIQRYLVPPKTLLDRDVVQVASLPDLYRVFERC